MYFTLPEADVGKTLINHLPNHHKTGGMNKPFPVVGSLCLFYQHYNIFIDVGMLVTSILTSIVIVLWI